MASCFNSRDRGIQLPLHRLCVRSCTVLNAACDSCSTGSPLFRLLGSANNHSTLITPLLVAKFTTLILVITWMGNRPGTLDVVDTIQRLHGSSLVTGYTSLGLGVGRLVMTLDTSVRATHYVLVHPDLVLAS